MYNCLFLTLSLAVLSTLQGNNAEECVTSVLAKRLSVKVPEGGSLSLSCIVQHCGNGGWTGGWGLSTGGQFLLVCPSPRHHLSNSTLTTNRTHLHMDILNVNQSDCGMYQCQITWFDGQISVGHMTSVNITAAPQPGPPERKLYYRVAVYFSACLVITLALVLACNIRPKVPSQHRLQPPPVPPRSQSVRMAQPAMPQPVPKTELVYAAISKDRLGQQNPNLQRQTEPPIIYSSLRFT
ncbi:uncharacterized protein si:dkey-52l18.4 isoform X1 [Esox lucius]|uniref:Ig-like domain-containing protein n=1 Tax=Esox lucius TaxID=8010 RepID=A0AAY5KQS2_ESOLU|nr:uncharacterized protein si:dkey-52l18.4 isoform X1 [Esox lucius]